MSFASSRSWSQLIDFRSFFGLSFFGGSASGSAPVGSPKVSPKKKRPLNDDDRRRDAGFRASTFESDARHALIRSILCVFQPVRASSILGKIQRGKIHGALSLNGARYA